MKTPLAIALLLFAAPLMAQTTPASPPPFSVDVKAVTSSNLPALHSFSAAQGTDGKWLIAGGRTNGLHLFVSSSNGGTTAPPNAFPPTNANQSLWVIDPSTQQAWSAPLTSLPAMVSDALSANNAEYYASGGYLYVIGGYGWSTVYNQMITFPSLTAIQIDPVISAIVNKTAFTSFVQQTSTYYDCIAYAANTFNSCMGPYNACPGPNPPCPCATGSGFQQCLQQGQTQCLAKQAAAVNTCIGMVQSGNTSALPTNNGAYTKVTGGGMEKIGSTYLLVFGQDFEGLYSVSEGDYGKWPVNQIYTNAVTSLMIQPKPLAAATLYQALQDPNDPQSQYHRRDLNVVPAVGSDGKSELVQALGGVFVPGQDAAYRRPILIGNNNAQSPPVSITVDTYQQFMSQYECAVVPLFDRTSSSQTNLLLGGISLYYVDDKTGKLKADTGLPFISALSALTRSSTGSWSEFYRVAPMTLDSKPARVGTDAKFMRAPKLAVSPNGVIFLDAIKTKTLIGWMFGGIISTAPNPGATNANTAASNQLFEIWLDPTPPGTSYWATTLNAPQVTITPNSDTAKK
jgi:hypothetical protein